MVTSLVTGESAESTGAIGLADLDELAWPTRAVGLADWASAEGESAEPTGVVGLADWTVPSREKLKISCIVCS